MNGRTVVQARSRKAEVQVSLSNQTLRIGFISLLCLTPLAAQIPPVEPGYHYRLEKQPGVKASAALPPGLAAALPAPIEMALPALGEAEKAAAAVNASAPVVGVHRRLAAPAAGAWEGMPYGRQLWRLALRSPGAEAFRIHFTDFAAGSGRVWIHDNRPGDPQVFGPYTGRGLYGDGDFWSDVVFSESVVIEYEPAGPVTGMEAAPFRIGEIAHLWDGLAPPVQQAASCHNDVSCFSEWADSAKGVAHIVFEKEGSSFVCSGSLLQTRNRTGSPYFLTAAHCFDNDTVARTVQAFWFYQTSTCNGAAPSRTASPRTLGARYMAGKAMGEGDSTLILLAAAPPNGVLFLGFDPNEPPIGNAMVGIHHPKGDYKRISLGARAPDGSIGLPPQLFYKIQWNQGATEGGSSGSPIFSRPGVVVGQLSHGPRVPEGQTACDVERTDYYGRLSVSYPTLQQFLEERTPGGPTPPPTPPPPPPAGNPTVLSSGAATNFSLPAVTSAILLRPGYQITVPQNATRLEVKLVTTTPGMDMDLYARFGQEAGLTGGRVDADFRSEGDTGNETIVITPQSSPALRAGVYFINLAMYTTGAAASGNITATFSTTPATPPAGGTALSSGAAARFSLPAVQNATLFSPGYQITVPQGARRLTIRLATTTPDVDVDLFAHFGAEPSISGGDVVADHRSEGLTGDELITVTPSSTPPLRAGIYFIKLALFTTGVAAEGTLTATVETGGTAAAAPRLPLNLTSGTAANFSLPVVANPTLMTDAGAFRIVVPDGATKLEVKLVTNPASVDTDLYVRFGGEPDLAAGRVVADYSSIGDTGLETITITSASTPPLQAGTYYITLAIFTTGTTATGAVTATVERATTGAPSTATRLNSGAAANFSLASVANPTLFTGSSEYRVDVPQGATRLEVRVNTSTAGADVDLYVRFNAEVVVTDGRVVSDFRSATDGGNETIVITPTSSPALQPGTYFIALALFSTNLAARGTVTATVQGGGGSPPTLASVVHAASFRTGAVVAGEIVSLFGQLLGPSAGVGGRLNAGGRVETRVDDTVVTFDGVSAPLFYVSAGQINAQVPYSVEGRASTQVRVIRQGKVSNTLSVLVGATSPGLFTFADGSNRLIALNQDGSLNAASNPAASGSVFILFGTGEGQTNPAGAEGAPATVPLPVPVRNVSLRVGDRTAEVLYAGAAPGFVGLLQINARVPAGLAANDRTTVTVTIGNVTSPAGTHIAVR